MLYSKSRKYSSLKRIELSSHAKARRKFKHIILSESSQFEKATYYMVSSIIPKRQTKDTIKKKKNQWLSGIKEVGYING